jgi:molecular chaperone DnaK
MMKDAESHADEDKKRREEIEVKNRADQTLYTAERMIKDTGEKIPISDKNAIESAMDALKKAIESNDTAGMTRAMETLMAAQHKASEALYKQQQSTAGSGAGEPGGSEPASGGQSDSGGSARPDGDVIDAEVVDDEKK